MGGNGLAREFNKGIQLATSLIRGGVFYDQRFQSGVEHFKIKNRYYS